ncbi:MAG: PQQ-binding-like beta-propeller repeat protein [Streptosporangiales bacterium]|nr:PQQ-binding-like beta-propeller repeat protein [Streptosporangiales bacterium]
MRSAEREWSLDLEGSGDDWRNGEILRIGDRYVAVSGERVVGISKDGKRTWERKLDKDGDATVSIAHGTLVVQYRHPKGGDWPGREVYTGIDADNGKTLWETVAAPYGSAAGNIVLTPVCRDEQTNAMDDCQLSARDARTGGVRWTIPTEHVPEVEAYTDDVLAVTTRPRGYRGKHRLTTYDAGTAARLGVRAELETFGGELLYPKGQDRVSGPTFMTGDHLVLTSEEDTEYPERCELRMVALDVRTGARDWRNELPTGDPEKDCQSAWSEDSGRYVAGRTGKNEPLVFDLAEKEKRWTGPPDTSIVATDGKVALVQSGTERTELSLYELGSGKKRWSDTRGPTWGPTDARIHGGRLVAFPDDCVSACHVRLYDLDKGLLDVAPRGEYAGSGKGWVARRRRHHLLGHVNPLTTLEMNSSRSASGASTATM